MRIPGLHRVSRLAWSAQQWLLRPSLVLLYHRIADDKNDPWMLCVTPKHFVEHLEVLRSYGLTALSMSNLLAGTGSRRNAVAITFDDGYADNLYSAAVTLQKYDAAATFFIVSGQVGSTSEFWWDELERLVLVAEGLPSELAISIPGVEWKWNLADDKGPQGVLEKCAWRGWHKPTSERQRLYRKLYDMLFTVDTYSRAKALNDIRAWTNADEAARHDHRVLNWEELNSIRSNPLFDVGAHTVNHVSLAGRDEQEQGYEIEGSRHTLQDHLGQEVLHFSYPHGAKENYDKRTIRILREVGFHSASSNFVGGVTASTDRYQIPRIYIEDWDGDEFARRLCLQSSRMHSLASGQERKSCDDPA